MIDPCSDRLNTIGQALEASGGGAHAVTVGQWRLCDGPRHPLPINIRVQQQWLSFDARLPARGEALGRGGAQLNELLSWNAVLPPNAKCCLARGAKKAFLAMEIPLDDDVDLVRQVTEACEAFCEAVRAAAATSPLVTNSRAKRPILRDRSSTVQRETTTELRRLCEDAGWVCRERDGGQSAIPLDEPRAFCQARAYRSASGRIHLHVDLEAATPHSSASQQAIALLLLTACRVVRMARAAVSPKEAGRGCCWEAVLPSRPTSDQLHHGLAALSVACRLTAREVAVLCEEEIARQYLKVRGWSSRHRVTLPFR
jgi:hypothetical protein